MILTAEWVLPIVEPPIHRGLVTIEDGVVRATDRWPDGEAAPTGAVPLGRVALLPALVNAHTHLELSHLHGRVPSGPDFNAWVRTLMALRRAEPRRDGPDVVAAAGRAIAQARACGTGLVGDVGNTLASVPLLRAAGMPGHVFHELIGFNTPDPVGQVAAARARIEEVGGETDGVRVSLAPHAPYSVSPALFAAIREDLDAHPGARSTVHLAESADEVEFLRHGTGPTRDMLVELGAWSDAWEAPGTSPVDYLAALGLLDCRVLVVHGVQCEGGDLDRLRAAGATLVSCPRSNRHVGAGTPPIEAFYAVGVDVAFGTDSLASVEDLNLFAELAEARRLAPRVTARTLLRSATLVGARALGADDAYGSVEAGKHAALIAVRVPDGVTDVEEFLVSGIGPDEVTWPGVGPASSRHA
jgi:cytosine/adenosine deaminase-related metal-dependent hydrolase